MIKSQFDRTFGLPAAGTVAGEPTAPAADREPSQFWLNVGIHAGEGENARFVSLPLGIALDNQKPLPIRGNNAQFNQFTSARNNLLEQLQEIAASLEPGEERTVGLEVQLRRIAGPVEAPAVDEDNQYRVNLIKVD